MWRPNRLQPGGVASSSKTSPAGHLTVVPTPVW